MEADARVNPEETTVSQTEEVMIPITPLIPTPKKENYAQADISYLVLVAVKIYQNQTFKDDTGKSRYILATEQNIADKIYEMTDGKVRISQSTVSKILGRFNAHKLNLDGTLYTIDKIGGAYMLTPVDDLAKQVQDVISANGIFFNNPNGISTVFAVKASQDDVEIVSTWLSRTIGRDLFKMFIRNDSIIVFLRVDTTTYKTTSRNLKKALTGDGLKNTNYALRSFAKSWKK